MTNPIDIKIKTVDTRQPMPKIVLTKEQRRVVEIFESSLCSSCELPRPRRLSATDLIALPKEASSDDEKDEAQPVSER